MKSKLYLLAVLALVVACSVEDEPACNEIKYPAEVSASIDNEAETPETKVYADANLKVLWDNDDRITLFNKYTYNKEYRFTGRTGANSGTFKEVSTGDVVVGNELDYVYAVYPYQELTEISNSGVITLDLPEEQSYKENSFGRGANTMVSATTNTELLFKNLCGYLVLKLYGDGVTVSSITIKGNNGEKLSGTADVTAAVGSTPSLSFWSTGTSEELTLVCDTPVELGTSSANATVFWLVVPPTTFTNGFTLTVTDPDGNTFEKSASLNFEIQRNKTFRMGALEVVYETAQPNNVIYYTSSDGEIVTPYTTDVFGANIVSNTYENGRGVMTFDGAVTTIGGSAFRDCKSLTSIEIPEGVTSIGETAFYNCRSLTSIVLPEGVTSIGKSAFFECLSLTSIEIPESVTSIGGSAFSACISLTSIEIPVGVTSIGQCAFYYCSSLTSIEIPEGVTSIAYETFYHCGRLTSIVLPEGVTSIGRSAFRQCASLTSIDIPNSVTSIEQYAFIRCTSLTSIVLPESVTSISAYSFENCTRLTSVVIPEGVTSIGVHSFYNCTSLTSIVLPESATSIGTSSFENCTSLTSVVIPEGVTSIGSYAFNGCTGLASMYCLPETPPAGSESMFPDNCPIYVPEESVEAYKAGWRWSSYADRIIAMNTQ